MYFSTFQRLLNCRFRQIHTGINRNLLKQKQYEDIYQKRKTHSTTLYFTSLGIVVTGLAFAAVPLYRIFCQTYNYGGTLSDTHDPSKVDSMKPVRDRVIRVQFNADTGTSMQWNFKPIQNEINVVPGETALAFYTATNPLDEPVVGISTYNVVPFEAAQYFNKIQCFCFEEQLLSPHEQVDMPVFFYIDPEFAEDPRMERVNNIVLSYTFFESKDALEYVLPEYMKVHGTSKVENTDQTG